jgi:hypothetical protein
MPESAEDKSKRIFIQHLDSYDWVCQVSIFYQSYSNSRDALEHGKQFRKWISRYHKHTILWRLGLKNTDSSYYWDAPINSKYIVMPYHTLFFTVKPNRQKLTEKFEDICRGEVKTKLRTLSQDKMISYKDSVSNQKPHNLKSVFFEKKINRFSIMNSKSSGA